MLLNLLKVKNFIFDLWTTNHLTFWFNIMYQAFPNTTFHQRNHLNTMYLQHNFIPKYDGIPKRSIDIYLSENILPESIFYLKYLIENRVVKILSLLLHSPVAISYLFSHKIAVIFFFYHSFILKPSISPFTISSRRTPVNR